MQIDTKYSYILHATPEDNNFIFLDIFIFCVMRSFLFNSILAKQYSKISFNQR